MFGARLRLPFDPEETKSQLFRYLHGFAAEVCSLLRTSRWPDLEPNDSIFAAVQGPISKTADGLIYEIVTEVAPSAIKQVSNEFAYDWEAINVGQMDAIEAILKSEAANRLDAEYIASIVHMYVLCLITNHLCIFGIHDYFRHGSERKIFISMMNDFSFDMQQVAGLIDEISAKSKFW